MKNGIFTLLFSLLLSNGISQSFRYEHPGGRAAILKKEKLRSAVLVNDVIPGYASYWATQINRISIEVSGTCDGKAMTATNTSDTLSAEQKNILVTADLGREILVKIRFRFKDQVAGGADKGKIEELEYAFTPGPDVEAAFPGGDENMSSYFKENVFNKVNEKITVDNLSRISVSFTVNEEGQVISARINRTSADPEIDRIVLEAINKMPKWKPAENSKGKKIRQDLSFSLGSGGC